MARDTTDERPLDGFADMVGWMEAGCKPPEDWRIGTEHEKFPFYVDGNRPVPYGGDNGIRAILEGMREKLGWEPRYSLQEMIHEMVEADIELFRRNQLLKEAGYEVKNEFE